MEEQNESRLSERRVAGHLLLSRPSQQRHRCWMSCGRQFWSDPFIKDDKDMEGNVLVDIGACRSDEQQRSEEVGGVRQYVKGGSSREPSACVDQETPKTEVSTEMKAELTFHAAE